MIKLRSASDAYITGFTSHNDIVILKYSDDDIVIVRKSDFDRAFTTMVAYPKDQIQKDYGLPA